MKVLRSLFAFTVAACLLAAGIPSAYAQNGMDEMDNGMAAPPATQAPEPNDVPPPVARIPMMQPVSGTMMASPPYGNAPLNVGFFVLANDPENIGFLTYQWNFGDGTVSSLPPELYIFHHYQSPGNYVCTVIVKTVDGRSITLIQGILVKPPQD
jgi:PKD domain-containing protein